MSLYVISDLHIRDSDDPLYAALLRLVRERPVAGDTLVLAGDVFDLFVGNKRVFKDRYSELAGALDQAARAGVSVHYIEGNHDFMIRRAFPSVQVHAHEVELELEGKRFLVLHGDTADHRDLGYRALRILFRSPLMWLFLAAMPGKWLDGFGKFLSRSSRERKPLLPAELPIERRERLRKVYRSFAAGKIAEGYDFVVMGHCHDLDEMSFKVGEREGQYVNVGYPRAHGSLLRWSPGDAKIAREPLPSAGG